MKSVVTLVVTAVFFGKVYAAPPVVKGDSAPVLVSTKGQAPKWNTLAQLQQVAAKDDPQACFELGVRTIEGEEVAQDTSRAIVLFEKAAAGGVANASFRLGRIYFDGVGVPVDYPRALEYYLVAAQAGVLEAEHNIGAMLVSARGVKRDFVEGLAWLIVATKSGDEAEAESRVRARLAKRPADIQAAEERAAELLKDLPHATVRVVFPGAAAIAPVIVAPPPPVSVSVVPQMEKPTIVIPKIEAPAVDKITLPTSAGVPAVSGK